MKVNRKVIALVLTSLLLATAAMPAAAALAVPDEVPIFPYAEYETYTVGPGQVGVIQFVWGACTRGLVNVFMKGSNFELELLGADGSPYLFVSPADIDILWGTIEPIEDPEGYCRGGQKPGLATWRYPLTDLPPGEYELHSKAWIEHPMTDGCDYDGDGTPDVLRPEELAGETVNYITVREQ
jgi:hypothetical protein